MNLSLSGAKMAKVTGLRSIMTEVASSVAASPDGPAVDLTIGNPAYLPEVAAMWRRFLAEALSEDFEQASCRYGLSRGHPLLVSAIGDYFGRRFGWSLDADNIVVGAGCQMLAFAAAAVFTGPSAGGRRKVVLPIEPEYTGYRNLSLYEDSIVGIPPKIRLGENRSFRYEICHEALHAEPDVGMLLMSDPTNPTGRSASRAEFAAILKVAETRDVPLLVDHAYGLPFPQVATARCAPIWHPNAIHCFTASKAGLPGERIGFAVGPRRYIEPIASFVSNAMIHAPQLPQMALRRALESGELDRLSRSVINPYYRRKQRCVEKLLQNSLEEDIPWYVHETQGGMFCWIWINHADFDDERLYRRLKAKRVFVMPGRHFFVAPERMPQHSRRCVRISLSAEPEAIALGVRRMAESLRELIPPRRAMRATR